MIFSRKFFIFNKLGVIFLIFIYIILDCDVNCFGERLINHTIKNARVRRCDKLLIDPVDVNVLSQQDVILG